MSKAITSQNKSDCIKILHVVPDMAYGGVEKVVLNYYSQLDHDKYKFDFVTHGTVEGYHSRLTSEGSTIYYLQSMGRVGYRKYEQQIRNHIAIEEYDIIHIHVGHLTGVYAKIFKDLKAKRIVCHAHTTMCVKRWHNVCMPLLRFMSVHYSDELVACGVDAGKFCFGKAKFKLLPNGLDFNLYKRITPDDIYRLKAEFRVAENTFVVGHVGHFSKQKNHFFLAEIIHDYVKVNDNVKFILVGDGPDREIIEKKIKDSGDEEYVTFAGIRNDVVNLMKMFDVFVLPSLFEGLPVVGIEAQAAGTPCVFSETIDKSVCICENNCEFLPINEGTKKWIDAINRMRNCDKNSDANIYDALCKNGYEISTTALKLEEIYNTLISDV